MPSTYSPLLRLELLAAGEKTNTWGTATNTNLGTLLEKAIAGSAAVNVTSGDVTLTSFSGSDDQARCAILLVTGSPGVTRNVIAPVGSKTYIVYNGCGDNSAVIVKSPLTTGASIAAGEYVTLVWNGNDFVRVGLNSTSPSFSGVPTTPTAPVDTNTLQIANTAYVIAQAYLKAATASATYPLKDGTGASGMWGISISGTAAAATDGLTTSNYNSYAPTLTGTGANGTWSINITGSASYATNAGNASTATNATNASYATNAGSATNATAATYAGYITGSGYNGYGLRTVSTGAPSGGSDGDIWYQY